MEKEPKKWKQLDVDYSPSVVVDENNCYISTACSEAAAKLFIAAYNDLWAKLQRVKT